MDFRGSSENRQRPYRSVDMSNLQPIEQYSLSDTKEAEPDEHLANLELGKNGRGASPPAPDENVPKDGPRAGTPGPSPHGSVIGRSPSPRKGSLESPERIRYRFTHSASATSNYSTHDEPDAIHILRNKNLETAHQRANKSPPGLAGAESVLEQKAKKIALPKLKKLILRAAEEAMKDGKHVYLHISEDSWQIRAYTTDSRRDSYYDSCPQVTDNPTERINVAMAAAKEEDDEMARKERLQVAQTSLTRSLDAGINNDRLLRLLTTELGSELGTIHLEDSNLERDLKVFVTLLENGEVFRKEVERGMKRVKELTQGGALASAPVDSELLRRAAAENLSGRKESIRSVGDDEGKDKGSVRMGKAMTEIFIKVAREMLSRDDFSIVEVLRAR